MRAKWHVNDACWYAQVSTPGGLPPIVRIVEGKILAQGKRSGTIRVKFPHATLGLEVSVNHLAETPTAAHIILNGRLQQAIAAHQYHIDQLNAAAADGRSKTVIEWTDKPVMNGGQ